MDMKEIIISKLDEFKRLRGHDLQLNAWLRDSDLWYWLYSALRLNGKPLDKQQILSVLSGELQENLPLDTYSFIHGYAAVYKDMVDCLEMQANPDLKIMHRWYCSVFGTDEAEYRRNNPVVYQWDFVPPHFLDVRDLLDSMLKKAYASRHSDYFIDNAAMLHLDLLKIYPYGKNSIIMAGILMMYVLMSYGCPLPSLTANEVDYSNLIYKYIHDGDPEPFISMVERSVLNRLEAVIEICRQAREARGERPELLLKEDQ